MRVSGSFGSGEWAREASVFARTAFEHNDGTQRRMHTASGEDKTRNFTSLDSLLRTLQTILNDSVIFTK